MIQLTGAAKHFGARTLFSEADWLLGDQDRVGLVGANGSGKSTLLKILAGLEPLDAGKIVQTKRQSVGYLPQEGLTAAGRSLREECRSVFTELLAMEQELRALEPQMASAAGAEGAALHERYAQLQHAFQVRGGFEMDARIGAVLAGLGFPAAQLDAPCESFSGGWQMRIALAKLLLAEPDVLLLDEPTNHLDLEARNWLEDFLARYPHACVLVSHDRFFLDAVIERVVELAHSKLTIYAGNYSRYVAQRDQRLEQLRAAAKNQAARREQLEVFINRFRYTATKAKQVQSRIKELERMATIEVPPEEATIHFDFPQPRPSGRKVVELRGVCKSYGDNQVFRNADLLIERGDRIALVGHNGAGKSTLIRLLAGQEPPTAGERSLGHEVTIEFFAQDQYKALDPDRRILDDLTAISPALMVPNLRNVLGCFLFRGDDVFKRIGVLSGGERNRYALARMLLQPANFLLLDEPTNHLDLRAKDVLLEALQRYNGTIVFVSHDRYFIDGLATKVVEVGGGTLEVYPGNYEDFLYRKEHPGAAAVSAPDGAAADPRPAAAAPAAARPAKPAHAKKRLNPQKRRQMEQAIQEIEAEIARVEAEIAMLEGAMARHETFRDPSKAQSTVARYEEQREKRAALYADWERKSARLEAAEAASAEADPAPEPEPAAGAGRP
ncbi:MAG TPA: ABC-F family ATP-binding cassette domain-containing protein [Terriglobales bacterium]|nr:ABC-F family ATP-binding cassette domain-containing protein [Terriglobales bacterium]